MDIEALLPFVIVGVIITNLVSGLLFALKLYEDAPENSGISFIKYWNTLMMDVSPGEKTLLKFEGDRLKIFFLYRKISVSCISTIFICVISLIIL